MQVRNKTLCNVPSVVYFASRVDVSYPNVYCVLFIHLQLHLSNKLFPVIVYVSEAISSRHSKINCRKL